MKRVLTLALTLTALVGLGCSSDPPQPTGSFTREELLDPETCRQCHEGHYREWASSMHAYAADDPVFAAMNRRGEREAGIGDFCVNCHAPMAVSEGVFTPGMDMADIPKHLRGVTCYFCHNVESVEGTHNNPLRLANDTTMRGGVRDPVNNRAHRSAYSPLHDGNDGQESAKLCGSCHDIVNGHGVHLERTYEEWQASLYKTDEPFGQTCIQCHMKSNPNIPRIADDLGANVRSRPNSVHEHLMPGIDMALTAFPDREVQRAAIQCDIDSSILLKLCPVDGPLGPLRHFEVSIETVTVGHSFPSGAAQDRRLWVEFIAENGGAKVFESGTLDERGYFRSEDRDLLLFRDQIFDADGAPTHNFWDAAFSTLHPTGVQSKLLPVGETLRDPHNVLKTYDVPDGVDRVTARVQIRAMGLEVIDDLIATEGLDPSVRNGMEVLTPIESIVEWTAADGTECGKPSQRATYSCPQNYRCVLYPELCSD